MDVVTYVRGTLTVLDQTRLPQEVLRRGLTDLAQVEVAIRELQVRGAPLIGIVAAYGVCLDLCAQPSLQAAQAQAPQTLSRLRATRPTAVNLFWALDRMAACLSHLPAQGWAEALEAEAAAIHQASRAQDQALAQHALPLLAPGARVITHCNTGPLATGGLGTALGALILAHGRHGGLHVYVDETRPLWQGGRLTTWELAAHGVPHTLICDNMAAALMQQGGIHSVWVGADRIAKNGDTANKIGTYGLAVAAHHHGIPFYVVAPSSTLDATLATGQGIPIEQRPSAEVTTPRGLGMALPQTPVWNPAFDVTPGHLIRAIITENGIHHGPHYTL